MICPECNGKGEVKYYRETDRDENSVTVEGFVDVCHTCHGSGEKTPTNADHIRSMTDEELVEKLFQAYRATVEQDGGDISTHWCDGRSGCIDADGNIECDEERHKACILRWLKSEAKP